MHKCMLVVRFDCASESPLAAAVPLPSQSCGSLRFPSIAPSSQHVILHTWFVWNYILSLRLHQILNDSTKEHCYTVSDKECFEHSNWGL